MNDTNAVRTKRTQLVNDSARVIGVLNAGSSSLKFAFYDGDRRILSGQVDGLGSQPAADACGPDGEARNPLDLGRKPPTTPSEVLPLLLPWAKKMLGGHRLAALGHRVVQGGMRHTRHERVTPELLAQLETLIPLAPLHQPHNLAAIRTAMELNPALPQVACFDTAFHRSAPEVAQAFALPASCMTKACVATDSMVSPMSTSPPFFLCKRPR